MAEYTVPDAIEPVIAYRAFLADSSFLAVSCLRSVHMNNWFDPSKREYVATCYTPFYETLRPVRVPHEEAVSGPGHRCGFYAKADLRAAQDYALSQGADILARVKLSGKVIPGDTGWRAEKMQIDAIYDWGPYGLAASVAVVYGVPLIPFPRFCAVLEIERIQASLRAGPMTGSRDRTVVALYLAYLAVTMTNGVAQLVFHLYPLWLYWVVFIITTVVMNGYSLLYYWRKH